MLATTVEALKELVKNWKEDRTDGMEEIYSCPSPPTVDCKLATLIPPPGPKAVEKEEKL